MKSEGYHYPEECDDLACKAHGGPMTAATAYRAGLAAAYRDVGTLRATQNSMKSYRNYKDGRYSTVAEYDEGLTTTRTTLVSGLSAVAAEQVAMALRKAFADGARWRASQQGVVVKDHGDRMVCGTCNATAWVAYPRSLDYYTYQCATCGAMTQRLTETGMSA